ncbi:MAG TPA: tetratricopeptide repeat protein [Candidatus Methanoperedens sp.]|nr:tetratricopeptide repeat protein [Candidatus Methanoperedens sp.]
MLVLAAAARVAYLLAFRSSPFYDIFLADHLYYREWALNIASGDLWGSESFEQGPLYAYALAVLYRLWGTGTTPVLAAQMATGLGTVALTFACARRVGGSRAALIAGFLSAVYGPFVFHESLVMKTFMEPFLVIAALYGCLRYTEKHNAWWLAGAGASLGLASLLREVNILYLPVMLCWGMGKGSAGHPPWRRLKGVVLAGGAFVAVVLPVTARNYLVGHEVVGVTTGGGEAFYIAFGPYAGPYYTPPPFIRTEPGLEHEDFRDEARLRTGRMLTRSESSRYWFREAMDSIAATPLRAIRLVALRACIIGHDFEAPDSESYAVGRERIALLRVLVSFGWIAGLGLLGIVASAGLPGRGLLLSAIAAGVIGILLSYPFGRFRLAVVPLWIILAGIGADWIATAWSRSRGKATAAALGAAIVSLLSFMPPPASAEWVRATEDTYREDIQRKLAHARLIPHFKEQIARQPSEPGLYDAIASQYEEVGKLHEAVNMYRKALELDPDLESAHWRLVNVLFKQGLHADAYLEARSFSDRHPASADGHLILGVLSMKQAVARAGRDRRTLIEEAEAQLDEAIRLRPEDAFAHYYRGKAGALFGRLEDGLREANKALQLQPAFPEALHLRGILEVRLGRARI